MAIHVQNDFDLSQDSEYNLSDMTTDDEGHESATTCSTIIPLIEYQLTEVYKPMQTTATLSNYDVWHNRLAHLKSTADVRETSDAVDIREIKLSSNRCWTHA